MLLLSIIPLMTSCANTTFDPAGCPVAVRYSNVQQDNLEANLSVLSLDNPLRGAFDDYANLRKQVEKCRAGH